MKTIFDPVILGSMTVKNRMVRSATLENAGADDGIITPLLKSIYEQLAKGGIGLIITGMMGVGPNACVNKSMTKIYGETFLQDFKEISSMIHNYGCKIVVQLGQCGAKSMVIDKGEHPYSPSDIAFIPDIPAKAMSREEIKSVVQDFGDAALKCKEAGADGVQIHGAHGYLISQFLSPYFNKRNDEYGGSIENRARIVFEVYEAIRVKVGKQYPIFIKINYSDLIDGGLSNDECIWVCKELDKRGIDAIEVSSGIVVDKNSRPSQLIKSESDEGSFADGALRLSSEINAPVISVGGYRSINIIEEYLNKGNIEAISMCRPYIREPDLINRWENGDKAKSLCISCNRCFLSKKHGCIYNANN